MVESKVGAWRSMLSDESGNVSSARVSVLVLIILGTVAFVIGVFLSSFGNKDGAAFCDQAIKFFMGTTMVSLVSSQARSAFVSGKREECKPPAEPAKPPEKLP